MYRVVYTHKFERSLRRIGKSSGNEALVEIKKVVKIIVSGKKLSLKFKEHKLHGKLSDCRECHVKNNLPLVYEQDRKNLILTLVDVGSHDDLFK